MKKVNKYFTIFSIVFASLLVGSCTEGFEDFNTNPRTLAEAAPEALFYRASTEMLTSGQAWNTIYAAKYRWMQYGAGIWGYTLVQFTYHMNAIGDQVYGTYNNMGGYITNIEYIAEQSATPENYSNLVQMGRIMLIAKAIQASDLFGSLAYSEAWFSRKGMVDEESMTPAFETQEQLVTVWDQQLKECIQKLQAKLSDTNQISVKGYDRAYNGNAQGWIKAANALRLRLAGRIWKKQPAVAKSIATEVLASSNAANTFQGNADSFILWYDNLYTNVHSGDWHSVIDMEIAPYALMDYLNKNEDPRKRMYFIINNLTPANIAAFNAQQTAAGADPFSLIPDGYGRWEGSTVSTDLFATDRRRASYNLGTGASAINMRPANRPQVRLWRGNVTVDGGAAGSGGNWAPIMTNADFCLLAAEFVLREGIASGKTAQQWYETGVRASLDQWNDMGKYCDVTGYSAMTETEINTFLNKPDIKWDSSKAQEQIHAQVYVEHYKNVDEAWAFWKRTGYPNAQSNIVKFELPVITGVPQTKLMPRRVKFVYPTVGVHNYDNLKKRLDDMAKDPIFGDIGDDFGRLWWDVQ
jgi:hypothetical protein